MKRKALKDSWGIHPTRTAEIPVDSCQTGPKSNPRILDTIMHKAKMLLLLSLSVVLTATAQTPAPFRPPSVPLIAHDPYFSVWSPHDHLTDGPTRHWTGSSQPMFGLLRIDGKPFRFLGGPSRDVPAMEQVGMDLLPTRTIYRFESGGIHLSLTFMTPALPDDLDVLSRPVTYLMWDVRSTDGRTHQTALYFDCSGQLAVNSPEQQVTGSRAKVGSLDVLRIGSREQLVLGKFGDNLRIDWGFLYLAGARQNGADSVIAPERSSRAAFLRGGSLPQYDDMEMPRSANDRSPVLAFSFDLGPVGATPVSRRLMLAYDDVFAIEYFHRKLRPYWRRNGKDSAALLQAAHDECDALAERCRQFDSRLVEELRRAGGEEYARIATLAYRQTLAAHKLVADIDGTPLYFSKENFSNGCIGTVDVIYPARRSSCCFNPELLKAQLTPCLDYAALPRWQFPFAPHDLGTYPWPTARSTAAASERKRTRCRSRKAGNMLI